MMATSADALQTHTDDPWYRLAKVGSMANGDEQSQSASTSFLSVSASLSLYTRQWNRTYLITSDLFQVFSVEDDDQSRIIELLDLRGIGIIKLCDGVGHTVAISIRGSVWLQDHRRFDKRRFELLKPSEAIDIVCGLRSAFVIDEHLKIHVWGQLGTQERHRYSSMVPMKVFDVYNITSMAITGEDRLAALSTDGIAHIYDGHNSSKDMQPRAIKSSRIVSITADWSTTYLLTTEHDIMMLKSEDSHPQVFYHSEISLHSLYTNRFGRKLFLVAEARDAEADPNLLFRAEVSDNIAPGYCRPTRPLQIYGKPVADIFFHYRSRAHTNADVCLSFMIKLAQQNSQQELSIFDQ